MNFFNIKLRDIRYSDLENLVESKFKEGVHLEYKSEMIKAKKLAKSMISFANTEGGRIIIGINEKRGRTMNTGIPDTITGIEKEKFSETTISNIVTDYTAGVMGIKCVELENVDDPNKILVIIEIYDSPDLIEFEGKYPVRVNDRTMLIPNSSYSKLSGKLNFKSELESIEYESMEEQAKWADHSHARISR